MWVKSKNLKSFLYKLPIQTEFRKENHRYYLTLNDIDSYVSFLTNRPKRIVGLVPIKKFVAFWDKPNGKFFVNPPNVAISTVYSTKNVQLRHKEIFTSLTNPKLNLITDSISYEIKPLKNTKIKLKSMHLGYTVIFFDSVLIHWSPGGF